MNSKLSPKLKNQKLKLETKLTKLEKQLKLEKDKIKSQNQSIDPAIITTFQKLGISLSEQNRLLGSEKTFQNNKLKTDLDKNSNFEISETPRKIAEDIILDSVSVRTTFELELANLGIIFCPFSKAVTEHPELVQKYLGSVVPFGDNFFACLNSAVFSDGTFVYIPRGVKCPMDLSTYFRINAANTGQFERTLIIADARSSVSYLEGCTAPEHKENQLHAAVVELIALEGAEIKYSTVQNWYAGSESGQGGVYNLVTKRGVCHKNAKISWTQVETGSAITWKYPSVVLKGENSVGQFYSIAITKNRQQADTGSKMIHLGNCSKSLIISKSITQDKAVNTYRGLVKIAPKAENCYNFTSCDSLILENSEQKPQLNSNQKSENELSKNNQNEFNSKNGNSDGNYDGNYKNFDGKSTENNLLESNLENSKLVNLQKNLENSENWKMKNGKWKKVKPDFIEPNWSEIEKIIAKICENY